MLRSSPGPGRTLAGTLRRHTTRIKKGNNNYNIRKLSDRRAERASQEKDSSAISCHAGGVGDSKVARGSNKATAETFWNTLISVVDPNRKCFLESRAPPHDSALDRMCVHLVG